eukprot:TRINITY_DN1840_c0_g1_i3.p1 TRINITY_DN1840_c0_g1~~TRINITY_DN1840_c0_g1_i3.p1  ORF type:complete len:197 (+),score=5.78 TRINITY_DN1840_c0_g1_i3:549-1139(+)
MTGIGQLWGTLSISVPLTNALNSLVNVIQLTNDSPFLSSTIFNDGSELIVFPGTASNISEPATNIYLPPYGSSLDTLSLYVQSTKSLFAGQDSWESPHAVVIANVTTREIIYAIFVPVQPYSPVSGGCLKLFFTKAFFGGYSLLPVQQIENGDIFLQNSVNYPQRKLLQATCATDACTMGSSCARGSCSKGRCYCY